MKRRRFVVRPCFDGDSLPDADRQQSWDVVDRHRETVVANRPTRVLARTCAAELQEYEDVMNDTAEDGTHG